MLLIRNTTEVIITISDLGLTLKPNETLDLLIKCTKYEISSSNDLLKAISTNKVVINDGTSDLTPTEASRVVTSHTVLEGPRDKSQKLRVHETPRALGTMVYYTGKGDDLKNPVDIGNGADFIIEHKVGDPKNVYKYVDFNCVENETWVHEGYLQWQGAKFDTITVEILPKTVKFVAGENTNYRAYNGLVIPAAGNGNILLTETDLSLSNGGLVYMPPDDNGDRAMSFWDAEWNTTTKRFENIRPNPSGKGTYNIFTHEVLFASFANQLPLLGNGFERLVSSDIDQVGQGWRFKFKLQTKGEDHEWRVAFILAMFRKDTSFGISSNTGFVAL